MFIRSDKVSAEQIPMQIVRSHPASRTGAKTGSVFAPGFHSAGDGMKATLVISPLRRVLMTFYGLAPTNARKAGASWKPQGFRFILAYASASCAFGALHSSASTIGGGGPRQRWKEFA